MITKIAENKLNIEKLIEDINYYSKMTGKDPSYIIMNNETAKDLYNTTMENLIFYKNQEYYVSFYGITIAYCEKLKYGEVEIIE